LLYLNKPGIVHFIDGTTVEGVVTRFTMYWLEVKLNDGRHIYVNKGSIKFVEVVEEREGNKPTGAGPHGNTKPGKQ
jgi:sRNA-binding regulator protein Hfq